MEEEKHQRCYEGSAVKRFQFYLEETKEDKVCLHFLQDILPNTFQR